MNKQLERKIDALFTYRKFPELFEQINQKYKDHELIKKLKQLQADIYFLDHHLESNWKINPKKDLKPYWTNIYKALSACGVKKSLHDDYCKLIYKYQKHELYLRENKLPNRFDMEFYYYFKSCDVKLLRRIICDHYPKLKNLYPSADWRQFDLITEVNDDVEDVFEDMTTINGNYFLIDSLKNGIPVAQKKFKNFITIIKQSDKERLAEKGKNYKWISSLTQTECKNTSKLLKVNADKLQKSRKKILIKAYI